MKRLFILLFCLLTITNIVQAQEPELIGSQIRMGQWDIWLHADGKTWQHTGKPGDYKTLTFEMTQPAEAKDYNNVYFVAKAGVTQQQYEAAGGHWGREWEEFFSEYLFYAPKDLKRVNNSPTLGFTLNEPSRDIKKTEQAKLVQGRSWYLPMFVEWYGTPKAPALPPPPPAPGASTCINDDPPPVAINEPAPQDSASKRYSFSHTTYEVDNLGFCVNDNTREVISGDTVRGRFQFVSYQRDHYDVESYDVVDSGYDEWTTTNAEGETETHSSYWEVRDWVPAGQTSHRFQRDFSYQITASVGGTTITPTSGNHGEGRKSFTWRSTVNSSTINQFTFTITAPNGQKFTATDSCTVFLPRGIQVEPIFMFANTVYRNNTQIAFTRIKNLRDVGEENVTLTYTITGGVFPGGATTKTESYTNDSRLVLPSGPVNAPKGVLRAIEFIPTSNSVTLTVQATATPLAVSRVSDNGRTLTSTQSRTWAVVGPLAKASVPALTDKSSAPLSTTYHYTTNRTAQNFTNGQYMNKRHGQIPYNTYTWASRMENYTEQLNTTITIDSWQGRPDSHPRQGRGAWEIQPLFKNQAHRTVRAGTGFEVIVQTTYTTNFDTRAPVNHNGQSMNLSVNPEGPRRVFAAFPYANYVKSVAPNNNRDFTMGSIGYQPGTETILQNTVGAPGQHSVKWELPMHSYVGERGPDYTLTARTHLVDKFFPDAYLNSYNQAIKNYMGELDPKIDFDDRYRFTVVSEVAGVSNLLGVQEDHVFIFGHIFRDIWHTRP